MYLALPAKLQTVRKLDAYTDPGDRQVGVRHWFRLPSGGAL